MKKRMKSLIEVVVGFVFLVLFIFYCVWLVITGRGKVIDYFLGYDEY